MSSNHTEVSVHCCHGKHMVASSRTLLSDLVFKALHPIHNDTDKGQIIRVPAVSSSIHSDLHISNQNQISCILQHLQVSLWLTGICKSKYSSKLHQLMPVNDGSCQWCASYSLEHMWQYFVHLLMVHFLSASLCSVNGPSYAFYEISDFSCGEY
jgi:hypothetical protein